MPPCTQGTAQVVQDKLGDDAYGFCLPDGWTGTGAASGAGLWTAIRTEPPAASLVVTFVGDLPGRPSPLEQVALAGHADAAAKASGQGWNVTLDRSAPSRVGLQPSWEVAYTRTRGDERHQVLDWVCLADGVPFMVHLTVSGVVDGAVRSEFDTLVGSLRFAESGCSP